MGYQESLLHFKNKKQIEKQLENHKINQVKIDELGFSMVDLYAVIEVENTFETASGKEFRKGDCFMFIGGERSHQRSIAHLEDELGIKNVKSVTSIEDVMDNLEYDFKCIDKFVDLDIWEDVKQSSLSSDQVINQPLKKNIGRER